MRLTNKLTELTIKKAKAKEKQYKLADGEGMYLRVCPNGSKYWQLKYRFEGKHKTLSFGVWPEVGIKEAREKRFEARKIIKHGIDPLQEKKQKIFNKHEQELEKEREDQRKAATLKKIAEEWYQRQSPNWTDKHNQVVLNSLKNHVFTDLGEKPVSVITKQDVISTLRKIEAEGLHETCYRVRQRLEAIFEYAEIEEHCTGNPASGLQKIFTKPQPKHHASLPVSELPVFIKKIEDDLDAYPTTKLAMMFMIHVFVRTKSLRQSMWNDLDLNCEKPVWIVPKYDMKNRVELHVPLSPQVVGILQDMKQFSGPEGYIFPQVRNPKKAMSENTLLYYSNRLGYAGRNTIHGFRTVASTVLHESGKWSHDAVELQMSHLVGTKVSRAYNRAEHLEERRKMMEWWSDYVDTIKASKGAINLHAERQRSTL